jgi:uncharacterized protein (TIGR02996 family)
MTTAPPRPELLALLDAIKDNPDDDTPRLVLADWLDEQDDPLDADRAKFIRAQIAETREGRAVTLLTEADRPAREAVLRRWLGPAADLGSGNFVRGLPRLTISGPRLLKPDAPALLATEAFAFVQFVDLTDAGGPRMEQMAALPEFRFVAGLSVDPVGALGTHYATRFFGSPNLTGLRQISFRGVDPGATGMQTFAKNPALARLRKLSLHHNKMVDGAVVALAGSPNVANLTYLNLDDNRIGDAGAKALATSPHLANLRELGLRDNPRLTEEGKRLLREKFGDRVRLGSSTGRL